MGFYGNITNTSKTTFQFDKIYPNRLSMDANVNNDGIFIGRYVLVEYDQNAAYPVVYIKNNQFYSSPNYEEITRIKYGQGSDQIYLNDIVQNQEELIIKYYKCTGADNQGYAIFISADEPSNQTNYITNYQIDENHYYNVTDYTEISFKGYDSTVWVKTTVNVDDKLITKYVNIADMNSVVPTFDIAADAPTMEPLTPHFDADSTNVYYKLHTQAPFGFRVKKDENGKSDEKTTHYVTEYDINNNMTTTTSETVDADIFYNKDALTFKKNDTSNRVTVNEPDEIKIAPTGKSKNFSTKYAHYSQGEDIGDIQELSIRLPSVGYMVSQGWDVIHGPDRNDDMREFRINENNQMLDSNGQITEDKEKARCDSLQGRLNSIAAIASDEIPVKREADGRLVGSKINGGKISNSDLSGKNDDAWIETIVDGKTKTISIHHTFNSKKNNNEYKKLVEKEMDNDDSTNYDINGNKDTYNIITPIVDATGHVVGKNTETVTLPYGYKYIVTQDGSSNVSTDLDDNIGGSAAADNTQDTLSVNSYNKWIQIQVTDTDNNDNINIAHEIHDIEKSKKNDTDLNNGTNTITIQDLKFDNAGHVTHNQNHTYTLPFGYKSFTDGTNTSTAVETQDEFKFVGDNWLLPTVSKDVITYTHIGPVAKDARNVEAKKPKFGETFDIEDWVFDSNGHQTNMSTHTIKIPTGSLSDNVATGADVITQLSFKETEGALSTTRTNVGNLKLTDYQTLTSVSSMDLSSSQTINNAFGVLEYRIKTEETIRSNAITKEIEDRNKAIASAISAIVDKDDDGTINKLTEVIDWINNNPSTATQMQTSINNLNSLVGTENVSNQIDKKIQDLNSSKTATEGNYISSITITNGILSSITETALPVYTLTPGVDNGTIKLNDGNDVKITGLKSAAFKDENYFVLNSTYEAKIIELEEKIEELKQLINSYHSVQEEPENPEIEE